MQKIKWEKAPDFLVWNKVKLLRQQRKLKQIDVAFGAEITITTLWMIEQGYDKKTTDRTKKKLARFFKCNVSDIFPAEMIGNISFQQHLKELENVRK